MKKVFSLLAVVAMFAVVTVPSFAADSGEALFKSKCAMCHGANAEGKPAMKAPAIAGKSVADVTKTIDTNPKHASLKKSLTEDQIKAVAEYVSTLK
jgi:mono/diheme cytochrome c family protein